MEANELTRREGHLYLDGFVNEAELLVDVLKMYHAAFGDYIPYSILSGFIEKHVAWLKTTCRKDLDTLYDAFEKQKE